MNLAHGNITDQHANQGFFVFNKFLNSCKKFHNKLTTLSLILMGEKKKKKQKTKTQKTKQQKQENNKNKLIHQQLQSSRMEERYNPP